MHRDVDYVVDPENGVVIVDAFTGRLMPGRRYSNGLHQAIEAKERVEVQKENKTLATITFQKMNFLRLLQYLTLRGRIASIRLTIFQVVVSVSNLSRDMLRDMESHLRH